MEIFESLDPQLKWFWYIALPSSFIFIVQAAMTFMGSDASDGIDADFDGDFDGHDAPFQLFSFRNLINFLLGFSWTGISFFSLVPFPVLTALATAIGALFVYMFFVIIKQIQKLAEDNSFKFSNTLNKTAEVYLPIPERKIGKGKIIISVKGSVRELDAMTENDRIASGSVVKVVKIEQDNVLIVEPV